MRAMEEPAAPAVPLQSVAAWREAAPLTLALLAVFMGLAGLVPAEAGADAGAALARGTLP